MHTKRLSLFSMMLLIPILFGSILLGLLSSQPTFAAPNSTLTVTNLNDSGAGSLRQAISDAAAGDTIDFNVSGTIVLTSGELVINKSLTIDGGHAITVSGNDATRVFNVTAGNVTLDSLRIISGTATSAGGGIMVQSGTAVTVSNSTLSGNSAGYGGGIFNRGTATVSNSTLSGNSANNGGGIYNEGTLTVSNSTLSGNSADFYGGGIFNRGTATVSNSTLSGNSATNNGGGIYSYSSANGSCTNNPTTVISNSTLSGNSGQQGGGIYNYNGVMEISHSSILSNTATSGSGVFSYNDDTTCTRVGNSIIAGNNGGGDVAAYNTTQRFSSLGHNLIGTAGAKVDFTQEFTATTDMTTTLPMAAPLADNGGSTMTHALLPGSPAIDAGDCSSGPATDQRGVTRPQDTTCDIGAFESRGFNIAAVSGTPQTTTLNSLFANPLAFTVSSAFSEPVAGGKVIFTAPDSGAGLTFATTVATIASNGTVSLPVTANDTVGAYTVTADFVGNLTTPAAYQLTNAPYQIFLPVIMNNVTNAPDLAVDSLSATGSQITVTIRNQGNAPVVDAFWVDVYLNPTTAPSGVNQGWQDLGSQGLVWGVEGNALPLAPGESLTLTIGDSYYWPDLSSFDTPLPAGSSVYAQVDSANAQTTYGGVLESHEISGGIYNNISGPVLSLAGGAAQVLPAVTLHPSASSSLPRRD